MTKFEKKAKNKEITPEQEKAILNNAPSERNRKRTNTKKDKTLLLYLNQELWDALDNGVAKTCTTKNNFVRLAVAEKLEKMGLWE